MPVRPLSRAQTQQNAAFLDALAETGNVRLATRSCGLNRSMLTKRRAKHPEFAQRWDGAIAAAHAKFHLGGGVRLAEGHAKGARGGEPVIVRGADGKLQLRLAKKGALTKAAEQAFLATLSATANVRMSAAATGFSHATLYNHRRRNPGFAREMRLALERGYDRLELALLHAVDPVSYADDAWRTSMDMPAIPPLSTSDALHLLMLHQREVRFAGNRTHRRRGEGYVQHGFRLGLMWRADQCRVNEDRAVARALQYEDTGDWRLPGEPAVPSSLPPIEQVTEWRKPTKKPRKAAGIDVTKQTRDVPILYGGAIMPKRVRLIGAND